MLPVLLNLYMYVPPPVPVVFGEPVVDDAATEVRSITTPEPPLPED
jgi:hypothetical protein